MNKWTFLDIEIAHYHVIKLLRLTSRFSDAFELWTVRTVRTVRTKNLTSLFFAKVFRNLASFLQQVEHLSLLSKHQALPYYIINNKLSTHRLLLKFGTLSRDKITAANFTIFRSITVRTDKCSEHLFEQINDRSVSNNSTVRLRSNSTSVRSVRLLLFMIDLFVRSIIIEHNMIDHYH